MPTIVHDHDSSCRLEARQSQDRREKSSLNLDYNNSSSRIDNTRAPRERMPSAGRLLLTLLVCFLVSLGVTAALSPAEWNRRPNQHGDVVRQGGAGKAGDGHSFTSLLESASPSSLHDLLHKYFPERFKDGVWESDVSAVEAVRRVDADLAASIVQLARRADNGTTTVPTTTTAPTTTTLPPTTTTSPTVTTPPSSTTTEPSTTSPSPTTTPTTSPTTSGPSPTTSTPGESSSSTTDQTSSSSRPTTTTNRPTTSPGTSSSADTTKPSSSSPSMSSSTIGPGVTPSRSGSLSTSPTRGGTSNPITNRPTSPSFTTSRPVTSIFTSTKDDGGVVVVTTTSWVDADPVVTRPTSTRPSPTLQNSAPAARRNCHAQAALFGVVVGFALLI